jgi:hypothetical protein
VAERGSAAVGARPEGAVIGHGPDPATTRGLARATGVVVHDLSQHAASLGGADVEPLDDAEPVGGPG